MERLKDLAFSAVIGITQATQWCIEAFRTGPKYWRPCSAKDHIKVSLMLVMCPNTCNNLSSPTFIFLIKQFGLLPLTSSLFCAPRSLSDSNLPLQSLSPSLTLITFERWMYKKWGKSRKKTLRENKVVGWGLQMASVGPGNQIRS